MAVGLVVGGGRHRAPPADGKIGSRTGGAGEGTGNGPPGGLNNASPAAPVRLLLLLVVFPKACSTNFFLILFCRLSLFFSICLLFSSSSSSFLRRSASWRRLFSASSCMAASRSAWNSRWISDCDLPVIYVHNKNI